MVKDLHFTTKISGNTQEGHMLRGIPITDLINEADFVSTLYLSLVGHKPSTAENKVLNAILVAAIDHGIEPASGFVPRVIAASGNDILSAMAGTLLALGPYHGGAITSSMKLLLETNQLNPDKEAACLEIVRHYRSQSKRLPGYGHPHYKDADPRTTQLFELARHAGLSADYPNLAFMLEQTLEQEMKRKLILNVDGAIAALLLAMNIQPEAGNALFAFSRVGGSIAHIIEEQQSDGWVRRLGEGSVEYESK